MVVALCLNSMINLLRLVRLSIYCKVIIARFQKVLASSARIMGNRLDQCLPARGAISVRLSCCFVVFCSG